MNFYQIKEKIYLGKTSENPLLLSICFSMGAHCGQRHCREWNSPYTIKNSWLSSNLPPFQSIAFFPSPPHQNPTLTLNVNKINKISNYIFFKLFRGESHQLIWPTLTLLMKQPLLHKHFLNVDIFYFCYNILIEKIISCKQSTITWWIQEKMEL